MGRWQHTAAGRAAGNLDQARRQRQHAQHWTDVPELGPLERSRWRRFARSAARAEARARRDWNSHGRPVVAELDRRIAAAGHRVAELDADARFRRQWLAEHPEFSRRLQHTQRELRRLDHPIGVELEQRTDPSRQQEHDRGAPDASRPNIARILDHLDRLQHSREIEPPGLSL
jgi:hypothetical protein